MSMRKKSAVSGFVFALFAFAYAAAVSLNISFAPSSAAAQTPLPDLPKAADSYVANEYIIEFQDNFTPKEIEAKVAQRADRGSNPIGAFQNFQENVVLSMQGRAKPEAVLKTFETAEVAAGVTTSTEVKNFQNVYKIKTDGSQSLEDVIRTYSAVGEVSFVYPEMTIRAFATPNDTDYSKLWAMPMINAPAAWDISTGADTVKVAVLDTGIDNTHPDLKDHVLKVERINTTCSTAKPDAGNHGTHVSGSIGAIGNNGAGVSGVNWKVQLLGYCVLGPQGGNVGHLADAIKKATDDGARVINMSLGEVHPGVRVPMDPRFKQAVDYALSKNVVMVVAAGNDNMDADFAIPARYPEMITVAAVGPRKEKAAYSNYGNPVDVAAPGGNGQCTATNCIYSTWPGGRYNAIAGTSMATPHVAGLVALMLSVNSSLTVDNVRGILEASAQDLGPAGRDSQFGFGLIDAKAALDIVKSGTFPTPHPEPSGSLPRPTSGPQPTSSGQNPPATSAPQPTSGPGTPTSALTSSPTGAPGSPANRFQHPCPDKATSGDYDCNSGTDLLDFQQWSDDFKNFSKTIKPDMSLFEFIRRKVTSG